MNIKHGLSYVPEFKIWDSMIRRCEDKESVDYEYYGKRGIKVCDDWHDPRIFLIDMGSRPSNKHSLDRIDNDGNYEPSNCRWATRKEQMRNTRVNRKVLYNGRLEVVRDLADVAVVNHKTVTHRLKNGWNLDEALTVPQMGHYIGEYRTKTAKLNDNKVKIIRCCWDNGILNIAELAEEFGVSTCTISRIVHRLKWKHLP